MSLKQMVKSSPALAELAWPVYQALLRFKSRHPARGPIPTITEEIRLSPAKLRTFEEYVEWSRTFAADLKHQADSDLSLSPVSRKSFSLPGTCALCGCKTEFRSNFDYANRWLDGRLIPNFRENLFCAHCGLKNRLRSALHLIVQELRPTQDQPIYITEQLGDAYRWLKGRGYAVSGSEYIPSAGPFGISHHGIRNEDLGNLTWPDLNFDFVLSFDVLEHVPHVDSCFAEIFRCLRPRGTLLFTAPFRPDLPETMVRALADASGNITHLMEPEYHGGNMTEASKGTLCFRYFGWDTMQQLKNAGFSDGWAWLFWSQELGYIGDTQVVIVAIK